MPSDLSGLRLTGNNSIRLRSKPHAVPLDDLLAVLIRYLSLFYGRTKSYLSTEKNTRSREEWWCDIKVDVATGSRDIYAAIEGAFDVQKVNIDNSIAEQYGAISKLPPVLQVQVQRVQFDPVKKSSFKSTYHLDLKETIYLDRYMDTQHPEILKRRQQCWEWKKSLRKLEKRRAELLRKNVWFIWAFPHLWVFG